MISRRRFWELTAAPDWIFHRTWRQCANHPECLYCYVKVTVDLIRFNAQIRQLRKASFNLDELAMIHAVINLEGSE